MRRPALFFLLALLGACSVSRLHAQADAQAAFAAAKKAFQQEDFTIARDLLAEASATDRNNPEVFLWLGKAHYQLGEIEEALTAWQRTLKLAPEQPYADRMLKAIGLWCILAVVGLAIGMAGYAAFEGMSLADSYVNAAMILSGMGPMGELKTTAGKVFAGSYAIFSGLLLIIATGFVLAPIFHRVLHHFHVETHEQD